MSSNKYQVWLEADGKRLQLPVNPESIKISRNGNNESVTIAGLGEATLLQSPKAPVLSFSSFFPAKPFQGCDVQKLRLPHYYISAIADWQNSALPVRLHITGCDIVWYVTVENFQYSQSGGDVGTYNYSLTLKEYKNIRAIQINVNKNKKTVSAKRISSRVNTRSKPKTYTVKGGDSLFKIAQKYYGDGSEYTKIYNANKGTIGANPNMIKAGMVLSLP